MPIYEYRCEPCQHRFEAFLASSSELAVCPKCSGSELQRLMSTFAASVPGGYKSPRMIGSAPSGPDPISDSTPKSGGGGGGGCGGGCACH
jgi:putative FmdB family regulatory protein